jgi:hypothetical protein
VRQAPDSGSASPKRARIGLDRSAESGTLSRGSARLLSVLVLISCPSFAVAQPVRPPNSSSARTGPTSASLSSGDIASRKIQVYDKAIADLQDALTQVQTYGAESKSDAQWAMVGGLAKTVKGLADAAMEITGQGGPQAKGLKAAYDFAQSMIDSAYSNTTLGKTAADASAASAVLEGTAIFTKDPTLRTGAKDLGDVAGLTGDALQGTAEASHGDYVKATGSLLKAVGDVTDLVGAEVPAGFVKEAGGLIKAGKDVADGVTDIVAGSDLVASQEANSLLTQKFTDALAQLQTKRQILIDQQGVLGSPSTSAAGAQFDPTSIAQSAQDSTPSSGGDGQASTAILNSAPSSNADANGVALFGRNADQANTQPSSSSPGGPVTGGAGNNSQVATPNSVSPRQDFSALDQAVTQDLPNSEMKDFLNQGRTGPTGTPPQGDGVAAFGTNTDQSSSEPSSASAGGLVPGSAGNKSQANTTNSVSPREGFSSPDQAVTQNLPNNLKQSGTDQTGDLPHQENNPALPETSGLNDPQRTADSSANGMAAFGQRPSASGSSPVGGSGENSAPPLSGRSNGLDPSSANAGSVPSSGAEPILPKNYQCPTGPCTLDEWMSRDQRTLGLNTPSQPASPKNYQCPTGPCTLEEWMSAPPLTGSVPPVGSPRNYLCQTGPCTLEEWQQQSAELPSPKNYTCPGGPCTLDEWARAMQILSNTIQSLQPSNLQPPRPPSIPQTPTGLQGTPVAPAALGPGRCLNPAAIASWQGPYAGHNVSQVGPYVVGPDAPSVHGIQWWIPCQTSGTNGPNKGGSGSTPNSATTGGNTPTAGSGKTGQPGPSNTGSPSTPNSSTAGGNTSASASGKAGQPGPNTGSPSTPNSSTAGGNTSTAASGKTGQPGPNTGSPSTPNSSTAGGNTSTSASGKTGQPGPNTGSPSTPNSSTAGANTSTSASGKTVQQRSPNTGSQPTRNSSGSQTALGTNYTLNPNAGHTTTQSGKYATSANSPTTYGSTLKPGSPSLSASTTPSLNTSTSASGKGGQRLIQPTTQGASTPGRKTSTSAAGNAGHSGISQTVPPVAVTHDASGAHTPAPRNEGRPRTPPSHQAPESTHASATVPVRRGAATGVASFSSIPQDRVTLDRSISTSSGMNSTALTKSNPVITADAPVSPTLPAGTGEPSQNVSPVQAARGSQRPATDPTQTAATLSRKSTTSVEEPIIKSRVSNTRSSAPEPELIDVLSCGEAGTRDWYRTTTGQGCDAFLQSQTKASRQNTNPSQSRNRSNTPIQNGTPGPGTTFDPSSMSPDEREAWQRNQAIIKRETVRNSGPRLPSSQNAQKEGISLGPAGVQFDPSSMSPKEREGWQRNQAIVGNETLAKPGQSVPSQQSSPKGGISLGSADNFREEADGTTRSKVADKPKDKQQ